MSGPPPGSPPGPPPGPPASGPPSAGPPPSGPPGPPPGAAAERSGPTRNQWLAIAAVLVLLLGVGGGVVIAGGGGGGSDKHEVFLEPTSKIGNDPFMKTDTSKTPPSTVASATTTPSTAKAATVSVSGAAPGLYGGTLNIASCDSQQMITFLEQNPDKERAWAEAEGIRPADVPSYIAGLTPVILRVDTRVTNHGFVNGRATPHASVLQAGTAVLVDKYGVPRARCYCGNPLTPPAPLSSPAYTGPAWTGFSPTTIVVVQQTTVVNNFTLIDVTTGDSFNRPPGNTVTSDKPAPTTWDVTVKGTANNVGGSTDSVTTVQWNGTITVSDTITGSGQGTGTFKGGCYNLGTGERLSDWNQTVSFNVGLSGQPSGTSPNRVFSFTGSPSGFANTSVDIAAPGSIGDDCRRQAGDASSFSSLVADAFSAVQVPGKDGDTTVTSGAFSLTVTLAKKG